MPMIIRYLAFKVGMRWIVDIDAGHVRPTSARTSLTHPIPKR
jgi:hypothetical protein